MKFKLVFYRPLIKPLATETVLKLSSTQTEILIGKIISMYSQGAVTGSKVTSRTSCGNKNTAALGHRGKKKGIMMGSGRKEGNCFTGPVLQVDNELPLDASSEAHGGGEAWPWRLEEVELSL